MKTTLKRTIKTILFLAFLSIFSEAFPQTDSITVRLRQTLIKQRLNDEEISGYSDRLSPDGSWNDINYNDKSNTNWDPVSHSRRLLLMCRAYNTPGSRFFHDEDIKNKIIKIIEFYKKIMPESSNWWYNAIGAPLNLGPALLLMKPFEGYGLDRQLLESYASVLIRYFSESAEKWPSATTGANKIWLLNSSIYKACIMDNERILEENFRSAFGEAKVMPGKAEGIKADMSFYQHGPQIYNAGYGMSFLSDITSFGLLAHGTSYAMSKEQLSTITLAVLDGWQWFCQRGSYDFSTSGREISRRGAVSSNALKTYAERLIAMDAPRKDELENLVKFIDGKSDFQAPGNRHFWNSDIMVQHGPGFYISARVPSKRTNATERMNNENLKRKWLPWGATAIMREGDEYRNIYAVWDWSRIPGVTSYIEDVRGQPVTGGAYLVSPADFAGGVSDGRYGMAAYDYSWDGVSGRKAWFFTPEAVYCLGAGIASRSENEVITSVNQCFSSGQVSMFLDGKQLQMTGAEQDGDGMSWVHHDGFGYYFPGGGSIAVRNMAQTGSWSEINTSQSKEKVTGKIFSLWIKHGKKPSDGEYSYVIVPSRNQADFERWLKRHPIKLIVNSPGIQAVHDDEAKIYGISFNHAGNVGMGRRLSVGANKPCMVLLDNSDPKKMKITVSDPTQMLSELVLTVSVRLSGEGAGIQSGNTTEININLPRGDEAGKSATFYFDKF